IPRTYCNGPYTPGAAGFSRPKAAFTRTRASEARRPHRSRNERVGSGLLRSNTPFDTSHDSNDGRLSLARYVAFLRGINVGGNRVLKMDDLRKAFESLGFKDVKTVLASGNVMFDAPRSTPP